MPTTIRAVTVLRTDNRLTSVRPARPAPTEKSDPTRRHPRRRRPAHWPTGMADSPVAIDRAVQLCRRGIGHPRRQQALWLAFCCVGYA